MNRNSYRIGFLIFDGFPMACLTSMIEPLRASNEISETKSFEWNLFSENADKVEASANVAFETDGKIEEIEKLDALILLSPPNADFINSRSVGVIRRLERHGCTIGAVSGGVFLLAKAKVRPNIRYSVHWCYAAAFTNQFPNNISSEQVIETDRNIMTASGAAAAFDLALLLIRSKLGSSIAAEVACWFQHPIMRNQDVKQVRPSLNELEGLEEMPELARKAIALVNQKIKYPLQVNDIANEIGITSRHLSRIFKEATGESPRQYFRKLRVNAARQMILYTNEKIGEIALSVGFSSASILRSHYIDLFSLSPEEERKKINLFRVNDNSPIPVT
ncbi:helix-turn-helix domain-containing protein [Paracoccaceae bacterium]|nr:helix-turn-helix domain-containing protein [Paracoccaceae bacterium]